MCNIRLTNSNMTTSTTLPENTKLIFEEKDLTCSECGISLEGKKKYYRLGDPKWKCEKCFNK